MSAQRCNTQPGEQSDKKSSLRINTKTVSFVERSAPRLQMSRNVIETKFNHFKEVSNFKKDLGAMNRNVEPKIRLIKLPSMVGRITRTKSFQFGNDSVVKTESVRPTVQELGNLSFGVKKQSVIAISLNMLNKEASSNKLPCRNLEININGKIARARINNDAAAGAESERLDSLKEAVHKARLIGEPIKEEYSPADAYILSFHMEAILKEVYSTLNVKQERPRLVKIFRELLELDHGQNKEIKPLLFKKDSEDLKDLEELTIEAVFYHICRKRVKKLTKEIGSFQKSPSPRNMGSLKPFFSLNPTKASPPQESDKSGRFLWRSRIDPKAVIDQGPKEDFIQKIANYRVIDKKYLQLQKLYNALGEFLLAAKENKNKDLQAAMQQKLESIKAFKSDLHSRGQKSKRKEFEYFQGSSILRDDPFLLGLVHSMQINEETHLIGRVKRMEDITSDGFQLSKHLREINRKIYETGEFLNYNNL